MSGPADGTASARAARAPAWFQWGVFPAVLATALAITFVLMDAGWAPGTAIGPAQLVAILAIALCERIHPLFPSWNRSRGDLSVDAVHGIMTFAISLLATPLALVIAVSGAAWLSTSFGSELWPSTWPLLAQVALALVIGEFFQYWWHRMEHETDLLWRVHAVHHSAPRLYWLNASRFHPLDILPNQLLALVPLILVGCTEEAIAVSGLVMAVHGISQHANVQLRCGPLNWIFSMAELHRWHHSRTVEEANHNYGQTLILWDIVFGTRFLPSDRAPLEDIGLGDPALARFPMDYWGQLLSPFRWQAIRSARR